MNPCEPVRLARNLAVTRLGLGTSALGGLFESVSDPEATAVVERAWQLGIRFFDTAPLYGFGLAERRLGRVLSSLPREDFLVASKVGRLLRADAPPDPSQVSDGEPLWKGAPQLNPIFDFSERGVVRSLEESCERLGLDRIDIVHIHDPDAHYADASAGAYPALNRLRREGVIGAVGVGMNQWQALARFVREHRFDCVLLAGRYSLLDQSALAELLPLCIERDTAVIAGGVFNSGILADPRGAPRFDYVPADQRTLETARRLEAICRRHDVPLKAAAIQFPLGHPAVVSVLVGCRSASEVEENVRMFEWDIPAQLWSDLQAEGLLMPEAPVPTAQEASR